MAKKIYHIPLQKFQLFIKEHKSEINKLLKDKPTLEYVKRFGKMRYDEQIEAFILFFKIDKNIHFALKTVEHFSSKIFFEKLGTKLNFLQFNLSSAKVTYRDFFYGICYYVYKYDKALLKHFLHQYFLHEHTSLNANTQITINYKDIAMTLLKTRKLTIKESFGEDEKDSFYKLFVEGKEVVSLRGKSIKTLRKKAYKQLLTLLIDGDIDNENEKV